MKGDGHEHRDGWGSAAPPHGSEASMKAGVDTASRLHTTVSAPPMSSVPQ